MSIDKLQNKNERASLLMREKILETTIDVIGREGYVALTASRLSQQAEISKGALYHHFDNLDDVRISALAHLLSIFAPEAPDDGGSFQHYLDAAGDRLFDRVKQQPIAMKALYAYIAQALVDDKLKEKIRGLMNEGLDEYARVIDGYFPTLSESQQRRVVMILDAYFGGSVLHWFLLEDEASCLAGWQQFSDMLISTLEGMAS